MIVKSDYSDNETEIKYNVLDILLNSPNPYKKEYNFTDEDLEEIKKYKIALSDIVSGMKLVLKNKIYKLQIKS